jgi:polyhydroxyalkanoate synthesis regulator phasin
MATERAHFGFIETFDSNKNDWDTGSYDDQFFKGDVKIEDGFYTWDISKIYQEFAHSGGMHTTPLYMTDFDVFVDAQARQADAHEYCYGLRFRAKWVVDLGLGFAIVSKEQIEKVVDELVKKGEISVTESKDLINDLVQKGEEQQQEINTKIQDQLQKLLGELKVPTQADIVRLEKRIAVLENQLADVHEHPLGND